MNQLTEKECEEIYYKAQQLERLQEMATVCKKTDGYGIIIEVYSEDHGVLGDKTNPAHAHLKTSSGEYLGKFAITLQPPRNAEHIFDCDKNQPIPTKYKNIIIEWGKSRNEDDILGWSLLKTAWRILHP
ncbi:MAG: hypothetical protein LBG74_02425 [Spirochaetaceae bacterium]|jgi:hypothetical protein|nr:hypothetical protein [Spirochaetaceae bacterium]